MTFDVFSRQDSQQRTLQKITGTEEGAARLLAPVLAAVSKSEKLKACSAETVWASALQGFAEGLIYGQEFHIVPFGSVAQFVRGWRGYLALLYATGEVADSDCFPVREGERVGRDPMTKRWVFDFSVYETEEEERRHPIIGYYAFVKLMDGRVIQDFMSTEEILRHADQYAKSFSLSEYRRWMDGTLSPKEFQKFGISYDAAVRVVETGEGTDGERKALEALGAWYHPGKQAAMFKKTALLKLLRSGRVRLANNAYNAQIRQAVQTDYDDGAGAYVAAPVSALPETTDGAEVTEAVDAPQDEAPPPSPAGQSALDSFFAGGDAP